MNKIKIIAFLGLLLAITPQVSIYTYSVKSIHGPNKPLHAYQGKKMLIVTLPTVKNAPNDSLLFSIDSLGDAYESTLKIIAVPSYEDGYTNAKKQELKVWYRNFLDTSILITEGMRTRKSSGPLQHPLFKWLTDKNKNMHFNEDVTGPRMKFFIKANSGKLFGVLKSRTRLSSPIIHQMLQSQ